MRHLIILIFLLITAKAEAQDTVAIKDLLRLKAVIRENILVDSTMLQTIDQELFLFEVVIEKRTVQRVEIMSDSGEIGQNIVLPSLDKALRGFQFNVSYVPESIMVPILLANPFKSRRNLADRKQPLAKYLTGDYNSIRRQWRMLLIRTTGGHTVTRLQTGRRSSCDASGWLLNFEDYSL